MAESFDRHPYDRHVGRYGHGGGLIQFAGSFGDGRPDGAGYELPLPPS